MEELGVRTSPGNEWHETHKSQGMLFFSNFVAQRSENRVSISISLRVKYDSAEDEIFLTSEMSVLNILNQMRHHLGMLLLILGSGGNFLSQLYSLSKLPHCWGWFYHTT